MLATLAKHHSDVSITDVATWFTWATSFLYLLDVVGFLGRLPKLGPWLGQVFKRLPRSRNARTVVALVSLGTSVALVFVTGLALKVLLVAIFGLLALGAIIRAWWAAGRDRADASPQALSAPGSKPVLLFGEPVITSRLLAAGNPPFWATVASIPVSNEPPNQTVEATAMEVRAILTFFAGEKVLYRISGGWGPAADEPANRMSPPNGQVELLGVAVRFDQFPGAHAFNADAPRTESALRGTWPLNDAEHHVHVHLRGSNVEAEGWFLLRNYSATGVTGVELQLERVEPPGWASGGNIASNERLTLTPQRAQERRRATLVRFVARGEQIRDDVLRATFPSPPTLIGNTVSAALNHVSTSKWLHELRQYAPELQERVPVLELGASPQTILAALDTTLALLDETIQAIDSGATP